MYDAENVRTAIITQEYREIYVTDRVSVLSQVLERTRTYSDGTAETFRYVYGEGLISQEWACTAGAKSALAGMEPAGNYLTFHYNHIGSTVLLTGEDGSIAATYRYGVYGELLEGEAELTPFLYNGQYGVQTDKNGLNYMRARYYDSSMKRFVNRDILAGDIEDSQSLNRYAYCCGNPVSYMDPFGLSRLKNRVLHSVLDVAGMIPGGIGVLADGTNALIYLSEGNFAAAGTSLLFMLIPTDAIGKGAKLLGASNIGARIIQGLGGIGICGYGVYVNGSQTIEDIDNAIANWESYSAEEKRLTAVLVACDIIGTVGPAVGSLHYAKDIASTEVYQAWEDSFKKSVNEGVQNVKSTASQAVKKIKELASGSKNIIQTDFIVSRNGVAVFASQTEMINSLKAVGVTEIGVTTKTLESGIIFKMDTEYGPIQIRVMQGQKDSADMFKGPRTIFTVWGTREYVYPNGQRIRGNVSLSKRKEIGHIHGQRK